MKQLDIHSDFQDAMSGYVFCTTQHSPRNHNTNSSSQSLQLSDLLNINPSHTSFQSSIFRILEQYLTLKDLSNEQIFVLLKALFLKYKIFIQNQNNEVAFTYDKLQKHLSTLNEKDEGRKKKGVYYTPKDVVRFIVTKSISLSYKKDDLNTMSQQEIIEFCFNKTFFEPTCGTGEFLLSVLEIKCQLLQKNGITLKKKDYFKVISSLHGNDINQISVLIVKLRILLFTIHHFGEEFCKGLTEKLDDCLEVYDFINPRKQDKQYDFIIGNPPYVEDTKSEITIKNRYGNIYANVLSNSAKLLKEKGVMGFIVPISFVSTPRMGKIRDVLFSKLEDLYIFNYADRPDCLFVGVHQKLSIIIGKKSQRNLACNVHTSNYQYWYKAERDHLFHECPVVKNEFVNSKFIPKLGNLTETHIYQKIQKFNKSLIQVLNKKPDETAQFKVYLNMRCTYWIKAFLSPHLGREYKTYYLNSYEYACFIMCLLNSSLFWWHWTTVSDCWHITQKEFEAFSIPNSIDYSVFVELAKNLENQLQNTKEYVGTKQTEYEYKHKFCITQIHAIDDAINEIYGLTTSENEYIKNFAFQYRTNKYEP